MARVLRPLHGTEGTSRRTSLSDVAADTARDHLALVRAHAHQPHAHRGMWNDDPLADPTAWTKIGDWPADQDFEPLIAKARAACDHILVAQLEADRAFCAAARDGLQRPEDLATDSSA